MEVDIVMIEMFFWGFILYIIIWNIILKNGKRYLCDLVKIKIKKISILLIYDYCWNKSIVVVVRIEIFW